MTYAVQFIFTPGEYDDEFYALDKAIDDYAHSHPGFVGVDRWVSEDGKRRNSIYYWADSESLGEFSRYPEHLVAKKNVARWYESFRVVVSEVRTHYGSGEEDHPLNRGAG